MLHFFEKIFNELPTSVTQLYGGDINDVFEVTLSQNTYVVKVNAAAKFPGMLSLEATGLEVLAATNTIKVPGVLESGTLDEKQFLILEQIQTMETTEKTWEQLGVQLAKLHQHTHNQFGLNHTNYIGSLTQHNNFTDSWSEFLITQRLQPMLEMAVNQGDVNYIESKIFDGFYKQIPELFPNEKPALLHGDLWSGNFLTGSSEEPVLIDPAIYFGHREMDIAMMQLFEGFSPAVFKAYNTVYPLEKNWELRVKLNQIYPLLVHVNLFGRTYWDRVRRIVEPFG